jgi:small conductance mechanosensitive channel
MTEDTEAVMRQFIELGTGYALDLVGAIVILVVGWIVAGWTGRKIRNAMENTSRIDDTLAPFVSNAVRYAILTFVIIAVLAQFGIQTASILAVLGTAGLAIGLAMQGTLSHFAAGLVLLILRPFRVGEYIDAGGKGGTVVEIGMFATVLNTADGIFVYVPNGQLLNAAIINYSRNPTRRIDVVVGISYEDNVEKALKVALGLLEADARVHKDPAPETMVVELADSSVNIKLRCWVDRGDYWSVLPDVNKGIKLLFDAEGISIPYPQHDVHMVSQKEN